MTDRNIDGDRSPARPPTLSDVARLAGVSLITASRILNPGVRGATAGSEERRRKVESAALALGYSVNTAAQAIAAGGARTVALIVSDIRDFGSATIMAGVIGAAETRGLSVSVRTTHDDPQRELRIVQELRGERHRGVIFAISRTTDAPREQRLARELEKLERTGTRVIVIGDSELPFARVTVDTESAARALAASLAARHPRIVVISGPADEVTSRERVDGFLAGLADEAVEAVAVVYDEFSRDGGYAAVSRVPVDLRTIDLISAMSDAMAVGVIAALRERGLRTPDDIEVSGFDDVPMLSDLLPTFSTVAMPLQAFGEASVGLLFDETDTTEVRLPARVITRIGGSTTVQTPGA